MLLPEAGQEPVPCYLRLDGLPGLWFLPHRAHAAGCGQQPGQPCPVRRGASAWRGDVSLPAARPFGTRPMAHLDRALCFFALLQVLRGCRRKLAIPVCRAFCAILSPGIALMLCRMWAASITNAAKFPGP